MSKSVPQLTQITTASDSDLLHVVKDNIDYKMTVGDFRTALVGIVPEEYEVLISQNAPVSAQTSGTLIVGAIYTLTLYHAGDDFSNQELLSGTVNTTGSTFRCLVAAPTDYTNGSILDYDGSPYIVSKNSSNLYAPEINTLGGNPVFSYDGAGGYKCTLAGKFVVGKTFAELTGSSNVAGGVPILYVDSISNAPDEILINSNYEGTGNADDILLYTTFSIKVYP